MGDACLVWADDAGRANVGTDRPGLCLDRLQANPFLSLVVECQRGGILCCFGLLGRFGCGCSVLGPPPVPPHEKEDEHEGH